MNIILRLRNQQRFKGNGIRWNGLKVLYRFRFVRSMILRSSLTRAYRAFSGRHPRWVDAYFDEHFLRHKAAPLLAGCLEPAGQPHPEALAALWAGQLRPTLAQKYMPQIMPVAADFLDLFKAELNGHRLFPARDDA